MSLNIDELKPKKFTITLGSGTTECSPPKMSHLFIINKIGSVFRDPEKATSEQINEADASFSKLVTDLVPELNGQDIDVQYKLDVLTQITDHITPADNKELVEKGVSFESADGDDNPKVETAG